MTPPRSTPRPDGPVASGRIGPAMAHRPNTPRNHHDARTRARPQPPRISARCTYYIHAVEHRRRRSGPNAMPTSWHRSRPARAISCTCPRHIYIRTGRLPRRHPYQLRRHDRRQGVPQRVRRQQWPLPAGLRAAQLALRDR
jgi:hypothetical protein